MTHFLRITTFWLMLPVLLFMNKYYQNNFFFLIVKIIFHCWIQQCLYTYCPAKEWQILRNFEQSILDTIKLSSICTFSCNFYRQQYIVTLRSQFLQIIYSESKIKRFYPIEIHIFSICVYSSNAFITVVCLNKVRKIENSASFILVVREKEVKWAVLVVLNVLVVSHFVTILQCKFTETLKI